MPTGIFRIEMTNCWDDGVVFTLEGDGSRGTRTTIMDNLIPMARNPRTNWLILDCRGLESIGSHSLGAIILSHLLLREKQGGVALVGPTQLVKRLLRRTSLDRMMPVMETVEEARLYFRLNAAEKAQEETPEEKAAVAFA